MPRPIHADLANLIRHPDSPVRQVLEAHLLETNANGTPREHLRCTKAAWAEADGGAAAVDVDFIRYDNGDLALRGTVATLVTNVPGAITYLTDLDLSSPLDFIMLEADPATPLDREISAVKVYLNPKRAGGQKQTVTRWRGRMYAPTDGIALIVDNVLEGTYLKFAEVGDPVDVLAPGSAAGFVTFDYSLVRPKPFSVLRAPFGNEPNAPGIFLRPYFLFAVYALKDDGTPADNVGLGYDAGTAELVSGAWKLRSRRFSLTNGGILGSGWYKDGGSSGGAPYVTIESGSYTAKTITFSTNKFDVGATPTNDLELWGHAGLPVGTAVTFEVRNDADSAYVPYTHTQLHTDVGIGKTMPRSMRATLTPNAAGTLTPRIKGGVGMGLRAVKRIDGSKVCEVKQYEEAFDPETMQVENGLYASLIGIKNGPKDGPMRFRSWIEDLLAQNYPKNILLRSWITATDPTSATGLLPRWKWLHKTDFLIGDWIGRDSHIELKGLSTLVKLKDQVPPYSPGTSYYPDGDSAVGSWTTLAGGGANLYQGIDETWPVDDTDGIRSGTSPANQQYKGTLPTPADLAGRRLFIDVDYNKDAAGGEQIDGKFQIYNNALLVMESPLQADVGPDRVQRTFELTELQVSQITDLPNLVLGVIANAPTPGTGRRLQVYGFRFRSGGRREVVTYTNQTLKAVCDDIVDNKLALEKRWRGALIESTAYTVSKQLTGRRARNQDGKDLVAKDELQYLAFLAGGIIHEVQGRLMFTSVGGPSGTEGKPIVAIFRSSRIKVPEAGPGLMGRRPEYFGGYRWDADAGEFKDEAHAFHQPSLDNIGRDGLGPPKWWEEEIGKWVDTDALADAVVTRHVNWFGCGKMLWPFFSIDRFPEIHIGDLAALETDKFCGRDPNLARELRGRLWIVGIIQRADFWGQNFTIWPRGYADILSQREFASRVGWAIPEVVDASLRVGNNGGLSLFIHAKNARAIRYATSTSAAPSRATTHAAAINIPDAEGNLSVPTLATFTDGQTLYVSVLASERVDGDGQESDLLSVALTHRLPNVPPATLTNGPFTSATGCPIATGRGFITWTWTAFTIYKADQTTISVPASTSLAQPPTATVSQVAGGALAGRTRAVRYAYVKDKTMMAISNADASIVVSVNNLLKVTSPSVVAGYDGWVPLVGTLNDCVQQSSAPPSSPIAFGTDWTEPTTGADIPTGANTQVNDIGGTMLGAHLWNLLASQTFYFYPRFDIANGLLGFTDVASQPQSPQLAAKQAGDGSIPLSSGGMSAATPGVGLSGGGGGNGGGPCLDAATLVESRARGVVALGSCESGEELRSGRGEWTRIQYVHKKPQQEWLRVRVATGASLVMTREHPMMVAPSHVKRALDLTMNDLLIVPGGIAEIVEIAVVLGEREQVDLVCQPEAEFWAGEQADKLLLTHNALWQS